MTTIVFGIPADMTDIQIDLSGFEGGEIGTSTSTEVDYLFSPYELDVFGKRFVDTNADGSPDSGKITGLNLSSGPQQIVAMSNMHISVEDAFAFLSGGDTQGLVAAVLGGNDVINGSAGVTTLSLAAAACVTLGGAAQADTVCYSQPSPLYSRTVVVNEPVVRTAPAPIITWPFRALRTAVRTPLIIGETATGQRDFVTSDGRFFARRDLALSQPIAYRTVTTPTRVSYRTVSSPRLVAYRTHVVPHRVVHHRTVAAPRMVAYHRTIMPRHVVHRTVATPRTVAFHRSESLMRPVRHVVRHPATTIHRTTVSTGRGIVRTGRTVAHTPVIIGETLTGKRHIVSNEGRMFASNR